MNMKAIITSSFAILFCSSIRRRISVILVSSTIPPITSSFNIKWTWNKKWRSCSSIAIVCLSFYIIFDILLPYSHEFSLPCPYEKWGLIHKHFQSICLRSQQTLVSDQVFLVQTQNCRRKTQNTMWRSDDILVCSQSRQSSWNKWWKLRNMKRVAVVTRQITLYKTDHSYYLTFTYLPPSRKLHTLSSRLETSWNVSLMICCCCASF